MRPVGEIARRTAKIGTKQLSERLPVNGGDEFALLAQTINGMLGRIEEGYRELTESYKQQQRFTADASHELRTPLAVIKANTSLALMGTRSSDEYRQALVNSDKAATRMGRIVQDLLLLTRADAAQPTLRLAPTEIWDVLEQVAEAFHDTGGASVCLEKGSARPVISADADALVRVFTNLVENAVRHTPATGSVTIDASQSENLVLVRVTDTGEGIAPEHLPHLMERFYRVDSDRNRSKGGTGLGLAICKTIVEQHHGSISIESIVGAGTKVTVALPLENQNKFSSGAT
jgi:signal transduction histidine kinase